MPVYPEGDPAFFNDDVDSLAGLVSSTLGDEELRWKLNETLEISGLYDLPDIEENVDPSSDVFNLFSAPSGDSLPENTNNPLQLKVITDINEQYADQDAKDVDEQIRDVQDAVMELLYMNPFLEQRLYQNRELTPRDIGPIFVRQNSEPRDEFFESPTNLQPCPAEERNTVKAVLASEMITNTEYYNSPVDRVAAILRQVHSIHSKVANSAKTAQFTLSENTAVKNEFEASIAYYLFQHEKEASDIGCLIHDAEDINTGNALRCYCEPHVERGNKILIVFYTEDDIGDFLTHYADAIPLLNPDDLLDVDDEPGTYLITFTEFVRVLPDCKEDFYATILYHIPLDSESCQELENIANDQITKLGKVVIVARQYKDDMAVMSSVTKFILRSLLVAPGVFSCANKIDAAIEAYTSHFTGSPEKKNEAVPQFFTQLSFHPRLRRRATPMFLFHLPQKAIEAIFLARMSHVLQLLRECREKKRRVTILVEQESEKVAIEEHLNNKGISHDSASSLKYSVNHAVVGLEMLDLKSPLHADDVIVFNKFTPDVARNVLKHLVMNEGVFDIRVFFIHSETDALNRQHLREAFNDYSSLPAKVHDYRCEVPPFFSEWERMEAEKEQRDPTPQPKQQNRITQQEMVTFPVHPSIFGQSKFVFGHRKHTSSDQYKEIRAIAATMAPPPETITIEEEEEDIPPTPSTPSCPETPSKPLSKRAQQRARANARRLAEVTPVKPADPATVAAASAAAAPQSPPPVQPPAPEPAPPPIPAHLQRRNLERMAIERIRSRLPAYFRGYHHGAPFGPPTDASLMRRTNNPTTNVHPLVTYFISKMMIKFSMFGNYFRMLFIAGKYYKTKSSFFSWDGAHQNFNRICRPLVRPIHRSLLNKQFFYKFFKKTIIYFTLKVNPRFVMHNRQYHHELVEYCKEGMPTYNFDSNLEKRAVTSVFENESEIAREVLANKVVLNENAMGIELPESDDVDDFWTDMLVHRQKPDEPERMFVPSERFILYFKYTEPITFTKAAVTREFRVSKDVDYSDDTEFAAQRDAESVTQQSAESATVQVAEPAIVTVRKIWSAIGQRAEPVTATVTEQEVTSEIDFDNLFDDVAVNTSGIPDSVDDMSDLLLNADLGYKVPTVFIPPEPVTSEVQSPVSPSSNDASKDMPASDKPVDDEMMNVEEETIPVEEAIEYSSLDTIGPYRKRVKRSLDDELSSKWIQLRAYYESDLPPRINKFTDIMAGMEDNPTALEWLHKARSESGTNQPAGTEVINRKRPPAKPLPSPIPAKLDHPRPAVLPMRISPSKVHLLPIIRSKQQVSSLSNLRTAAPTVPVVKPPPTPTTVSTGPGKEPSPEIVVVAETKKPAPANPPPTTSEVIIVGETKFTRPVITTPSKMCPKRAISQPPMFVIPKKRVKIPPKVKIDRVVKYHLPGSDKNIPTIQELPPIEDKRQLRFNFELPRAKVFIQRDNAMKYGAFLELLHSCPRLRKIAIGHFNLMLKEKYKTPAQVAEHNKNSRDKVAFKGVIPRNIPKMLEEPAVKAPMFEFWIRDFLQKMYVSRVSYNSNPPKNGVRFGDTSVSTVNMPRFKVLKNVLNSIMMRGLDSRELMVIASAQRAFQSSLMPPAQQNRPSNVQYAPSQLASVRIITPRPGHMGMRAIRVSQPRMNSIPPPQQPRMPSMQPPPRPVRMPVRNMLLPTSAEGSFIAKRLGSTFHSHDFHTKHCGCAKPLSYPVFQHEVCIKFKKDLFAEVRSMLDKKLITADNKAHLFGRFGPVVVDIIKNATTLTHNLTTTTDKKPTEERKVTFDEAIVSATKQYKQRRRFVRKQLRKRRKMSVFKLFKKKLKPRPEHVDTPETGGIRWSLKSFRDVGTFRCRTRCKRRQQTLMVIRGVARNEAQIWLRQYEFRYNFKMFDLSQQPQRRMSPWMLKKVMAECRSIVKPEALRITPGLARESFKETVDHPTRPFNGRRPRSNSFCGARSSDRLLVVYRHRDDIGVHLSGPPKEDFNAKFVLEELKTRLKAMFAGKSVVATLPKPIKFDPKKFIQWKATLAEKQAPAPKKRKPWDINLTAINRDYLGIDRTRGPSHFMIPNPRSQKPYLNKYIRYRQKSTNIDNVWNSFTPRGPRSVMDVFNHDLA